MSARLSPEEQWDRTVALYLRTESEPLGPLRTVGVIVRTHRLFTPGDVVLAARVPSDRCPVWAQTSKGYFVRHYHVRYRGRARLPGGPLRLVDLPSELQGLSPSHPAVRHHVLRTLRERRPRP